MTHICQQKPRKVTTKETAYQKKTINTNSLEPLLSQSSGKIA